MSVTSLCVHRCSSVVPCLGGMSVAMRERNRIRIPVLGSAVFALSFASSLSQTTPQNAKQESAIRARVAEVILDVVVTDKKGRQITDLNPSEFEILEDGVPQNIISSRVVGAAEAAAQNSKSPAPPQATRPATQAAPQDSRREINLVTLVFDRISPYGRQMARDAARQYFKELNPTDFVSVMAIDRALRVLQPFTNDVARLSAAVSLAADGTPQQFAEVSNAVRDAIDKAQAASSAAESSVASAGTGGGPGSDTGAAFATAKLNEVIASMLRQTGVGEQTIQGRATIESLMSIIRGEQAYPGRKAVVYFAERISLPTQVVERFRDLISAANRSNVSFYCVDTTGLDSTRQLEEMSQELKSLSSVSQGQQRRRGGAVTTQEATLGENTDNVLRKSAQNTLADLAESTGGILISNTNDLRPGLRHVSEDLSSHYELSYIPANTVYDGSFRKVEVRVKRPGLITRSRQGYYAVRGTDATVSAFEVPMLNALELKLLPRELNYRSASLTFPTRGLRTQTVLYLEIPLSDFSFPVDEAKNEYEARVDILVFVKNPEGRTVEKFSQQFPFRGPRDKAPETQGRNLVFYRTAELAPGRYTLETVVQDGRSRKITAKRAVLVVPARPPQSLALSSIVLVRRLDASRGDSDLAESPLLYNRQMVIPNLSSAINAKEWPELAFYFVAIAPPGESRTTVDMIVSKEGQPVGHMGERPLPLPDEKGRIPYIATLPLSSMSSGNYNVKVLVSRAGIVTSSAVAFSIE